MSGTFPHPNLPTPFPFVSSEVETPGDDLPGVLDFARTERTWA